MGVFGYNLCYSNVDWYCTERTILKKFTINFESKKKISFMNRNKPERCITSAGETIFIIPLPWQYKTCTIYLLILKLFSDFKLCLYKFIYIIIVIPYTLLLYLIFCPSPSSPPLSLYNIVFFRIFSLSLLYHELLLLFLLFIKIKKYAQKVFCKYNQ